MSTAAKEFTGRVLSPEEWGRVEHVLSMTDEPRPVPNMAKILAVEQSGEVVATFSSQWMVYLSHLWVREDVRGGYFAETLARKTIELYPAGTRALMNTGSPHVERLAFRIGMEPIKGQLWRWNGQPVGG